MEYVAFLFTIQDLKVSARVSYLYMMYLCKTVTKRNDTN